MDFLKDLNIDKVRNLAEDAFNQAKPKTDLEAKVYEVLSHKNWGSSSTIMNEIARDTYDYDKFAVISQLTWEALENQRPAAWRVVFKGLTLLEHLIKNGSERCVDDARSHGHSLKALYQFNYYEGTIDRGLGVREKSKQLVEILSDDDRIREERQKARQLREKFGGSLGGTGNQSGGGGGRYAGYGNDDWNASGSSGGGGYGDGGIGSERRSGGGNGGRYDTHDDDPRGSGGSGGGPYSGRYDNDERPVAAPVHTAAPTFAAIPDDAAAPKKSSKKKKKAATLQTAALPTPAPEVDLFSFDAPAPAAAAISTTDDDFGDFAGAGTSSSSFVSGAAGTHDLFAAAAVPPPFTAVPQPAASFDAFGGGPATVVASDNQFGAFATSNAQPTMMMSNSSNNNNNNVMGGAMMMPPPVMSQTNVMGGTSVMGGSIGMTRGNNVMGGGGTRQAGSVAQPQHRPPAADDDDFGDFSGVGGTSGSTVIKDPLGKLISLDGLSKNTSKKEDKLNEPIIANAAAATFVQEKDFIQASVKQSTRGSGMSFAGIDGLNKPSGMGGMSVMPHHNMTTPMMNTMSMGSNPSVMGSSGSVDVISNIFDPSAMQPQKSHATMPTQQQFQGGGGMMPLNNTTMSANPQMMGMTMGSSMGMMNPGMQPQGFGGMQGGMGMQSGMQGGMPNGFNTSGTMNQQQMMMNNQNMGGMQGTNMMNNTHSFGGFPSGMGGQQQGSGMGGQQQGGGGTMGGYPTSGFR